MLANSFQITVLLSLDNTAMVLVFHLRVTEGVKEVLQLFPLLFLQVVTRFITNSMMYNRMNTSMHWKMSERWRIGEKGKKGRRWSVFEVLCKVP